MKKILATKLLSAMATVKSELGEAIKEVEDQQQLDTLVDNLVTARSCVLKVENTLNELVYGDNDGSEPVFTTEALNDLKSAIN